MTCSNFKGLLLAITNSLPWRHASLCVRAINNGCLLLKLYLFDSDGQKKTVFVPNVIVYLLGLYVHGAECKNEFY